MLIIEQASFEIDKSLALLIVYPGVCTFSVLALGGS